jgi:hypothetical protein
MEAAPHAMLMHVYGADTYRRQRAVHEITSKYVQKYPDGSVGFFDLEIEGALTELRAFAEAPGLFAKTSLAVVTNPAEGEKEFVKFLKSAKENQRATILVVADKKLPKDFALLYEKGVGPAKNDFEPLEGMEFLKFLKADAAGRGLSISDEQLKAIGIAYDRDTWGAVTEIQRVAFGGALEERGTTFDFIGLIRTLCGPGAVAQRMRALFLLLDYDEPAKVFNMAAAFAAGQDKVRMADYDLAVKSGKLEYSEALLEYVLS